MRRLKIRAHSLYRGPFLNPPPPRAVKHHFWVLVTLLWLFVCSYL